MSHRPNFIDTRLDSRQSPVPDLPSPRAGEVPPALSPLDALAMQGRLLARKFEEEERQGRRISRLPALTIQNEFARPRPGYFRSMSADTRSASDDAASMELRDEDTTTSHAKETVPEARPKSHYPSIQMEEASPSPRDPFRSNLSPLDEDALDRHLSQDYFTIPRTSSPDHMDSRQQPRSRAAHEGPPASYPDPKYPSNESRTLRPYPPKSLAPQRSPIPQRSPPRASPSIRSVPGDSSDDVDGMSLGGSLDSLPPRQFSNNPYSRSHSPASPPSAAIPRSPSVSSEYSIGGGSRLSRPAYNFSRPLSTQHSFDSKSWVDSSPRPSDDRPTLGTPTRQDSEDSALVPHDVHTPVSMTSDEYNATQDTGNQPAPSYIYAKYSLPRGRAVNRESMDALKFMNQFFKDDSAVPGGHRPPSPPSPTQSMHASTSAAPTPQEFTLPIRGSSLDYTGPRPRVPSIPSSATDSSASTIRPRTAQSIADMSPEEHLDQGIKCHETGSLQKSTYHLRLAARAGHPTGMLLYALACRHGWGMRQNEAEGFNWLKKAVDSAQLEIAEDEDLTKKGRSLDLLERKTHKAQFALGIYELGKSYMEGWGVHQDKALALRCFEIAGNWGDSDALTEAGYCYAQGQGCKKDLKKAARFYRLAATKGASMVGQSWIYKEKYMDDDESDNITRAGRSPRGDSSEKKLRDKSRTRTIFGRKKNAAS